MSLLDKANQCVIVFPEEVVEDADGNTKTQASDAGFHTRARIQPMGSGAGRGAETADEGFETEKMYSLRFPRSFCHVLGAQAQVEWMGVRWAVHGDAMHYESSPRTAHRTYVLRRC